jgi:hypothetical protein
VGVNVSVVDDALDVRFFGWAVLLALKRSLRIPLAEVVSVSVQDVRDARRLWGWRIAGGNWPGWFTTGHFTVTKWARHVKGERALLYYFRGSRVLVIETMRRRPRFVAVQVDDPELLRSHIIT